MSTLDLAILTILAAAAAFCVADLILVKGEECLSSSANSNWASIAPAVAPSALTGSEAGSAPPRIVSIPPEFNCQPPRILTCEESQQLLRWLSWPDEQQRREDDRWIN